MKPYAKRDFPVADIRRFLEPGPIVLVSSAYKGERNIMTMGWHMVMEFVPSRVGCFITDANHSFELVRQSRELVINIPEVHLAETVVGIGNCSGRDVDKFQRFALTAEPATELGAPLIAECYANLECRVANLSLLGKYSLFILEVVKAHAPRRPKYPKTIHYRGDGILMVSGRSLDLSAGFEPEKM